MKTLLNFIYVVFGVLCFVILVSLFPLYDYITECGPDWLTKDSLDRTSLFAGVILLILGIYLCAKAED